MGMLPVLLFLFVSADSICAVRFSSTIYYKPPNCTYQATYADMVYQHYNGTFENGVKFDSSHDRSRTYNFRLGTGAVIEGMDKGMMGMCKGERRKIVIPSWLGYGDHDHCGSTLYFDVELVDVEPAGYSVEVIYRPDECPRKAVRGDRIQEHYKAYLYGESSPFDDSYRRGVPAEFTIGDNQMIKAIDLGVIDMCIGEKRRITGPSILAFGAEGVKGSGFEIPPHATIIIEVELLRILSGTLIRKKLDGPSCTSSMKVAENDIVTVKYIGRTEAGISLNSGDNPEIFAAGSISSQLAGLALGVVGMCEGETRELHVPPELATGGDERIPKGVRLTLEVFLFSKRIDESNPSSTVSSQKGISLTTESTTTTTPPMTTTKSTTGPSTTAIHALTTKSATTKANLNPKPTQLLTTMSTSSATKATTTTQLSTSPPKRSQQPEVTPASTAAKTLTPTRSTANVSAPSVTSTLKRTEQPIRTSTASVLTKTATVRPTKSGATQMPTKSTTASQQSKSLKQLCGDFKVIGDETKLFDEMNSHPDRYLGILEVQSWIEKNKKEVSMQERGRLLNYYFYCRDKNGDHWITKDEFYGK